MDSTFDSVKVPLYATFTCFSDDSQKQNFRKFCQNEQTGLTVLSGAYGLKITRVQFHEN